MLCEEAAPARVGVRVGVRLRVGVRVRVRVRAGVSRAGVRARAALRRGRACAPCCPPPARWKGAPGQGRYRGDTGEI